MSKIKNTDIKKEVLPIDATEQTQKKTLNQEEIDRIRKEVAEQLRQEELVARKQEEENYRAQLIDIKRKEEERLEKERQKDNKIVRVRFSYPENPGGVMKVNYKKHAGDPVRKYTFVDNNVYTVPYGLVTYVNNTCSYPVHKYEVDENSRRKNVVIKRKRRCFFESLDFVDISDRNAVDAMGPRIIQEF